MYSKNLKLKIKKFELNNMKDYEKDDFINLLITTLEENEKYYSNANLNKNTKTVI